ncbi:MAG: gliding motility-associated C-terminal domain-containing protein [Bacteroidota bacterium]
MRYLLTFIILLIFHFSPIQSFFLTGQAFFIFNSQAQSPSLRCLSVDLNGDVQLTWMPPSDTCGSFNSYDIYYSTSISGTYTLVGSVTNFGQTTYTHDSTGADASSVYYYVQSNSGCPSNISDTLQTIFLTVTNTVIGTANLSWNSLHTPSIPSSSGLYVIYREDTSGSRLLIDSLFQIFSYSDTITVCKDSIISFQIEIQDSSGCISASSIAYLESDDKQPGVVIIDTISVDASGLATISWTPSSSYDVVGYIIYSSTGQGTGDSIDFVSGMNNTYYVDLNSNPGALSEPYSIAAIDSCGNRGIIGVEHNTIFLTNVLNTCTRECTLSWNKYINWPSGVSDYYIYVSENGGLFFLLGTADSTQYTQTGLIETISYCYVVRAVDNSGQKTSTSNILCGFTDTISNVEISFELTVQATYSVTNSLSLQWDENVAWLGLADSFDIYRNINNGIFDPIPIARLPFSTTSYTDDVFSFRDETGDFCYFIVSVKTTNDIYGCVDTSNIACASQIPKFIVPNAFTPNGDNINDVFPIIRDNEEKFAKIFIDVTDYLFIIYNRWGQKIFETNNPDQGWDGLFNGFPIQNDAYVYYFKFSIKNGIPIEKTGTITLLR